MMQQHEVKQAKDLHRALLMKKPNVVGVGVGYKRSHEKVTSKLGIVVMVRHKMPLSALEPDEVIPKEVGGVRTDVIEVGELRPQISRTEHIRPAPGGVSIGHYKITAGTFGAVVQDSKTGAPLILSNNHVFAYMNNAQIGDPILQPGVIDGGQRDQDVIARLERFCPIQFTTAPASCNIALSYVNLGNAIAKFLGSQHQLQAMKTAPMAVNEVDAAVAKPLDPSMISDEILEIGRIDGTLKPSLGMFVRKSGRTTGLTTDEIVVLDATVSIQYESGTTAIFDNQIVTGPMSQGGDSGALLVARNIPAAVGLLFAGSDQSTIYNPIEAVMRCLDIKFNEDSVFSKTATLQNKAKKAQAIKSRYESSLMKKANVVGVGIGLKRKNRQRTNEIALIVMVSKKIPKEQLAPEDLIPSEIEGVPVDVREVGEIKSHQDNLA